MDDSSLVAWRLLDRKDFERIAEAVIEAEFEAVAGLTARALDGRGGDGGLDVAVYGADDEVVEIFQLKHFPEGFSGGHGKVRKAQIRKSFAAAQKHEPRKWTLVMPQNLTPPEQKWLRGMAAELPITVEWMGSTGLDRALAKHPELVAYFTRRPLIDALKEIGQEQAALIRPGDYESRLKNLASRAENRSPFWGEDISIVDGVVTKTLRQKHPRAQEVEPISYSLTTTRRVWKNPLGESLEELRTYGALEVVVIPSDMIESFDITGPEWLNRPVVTPTIEIHPPVGHELNGAAAELRFLSSSGATASSYAGTVTGVATGEVGATVQVELPGGMRVRFRIPLGADIEGRIDITTNFGGERATDVSDALEMATELGAPGRVELWLGGRGPFTFERGAESEGQTRDLGELRSLADDLATIARVMRVALTMPDSLTNEQRLEIRTTRQLLEGRCILMPRVTSFNATVNPNPGDDVVDLLSAPHAFVVDEKSHIVELLGHRLDLGTLRAYHPSVVVGDASRLLQAFRAGNLAGERISFQPANDEAFWMFLPDKYTSNDDVLRLEPWALGAAPEHESLEAQMKKQGSAIPKLIS